MVVAGFLFALIVSPTLVRAAELRVLIIPAMTYVMQDLMPQFEKSTGDKLLPRFGLPTQLKDAIDAGDFDVAIFDGDTVASLVKAGKVRPDMSTEIARVGLGVAGKVGTPHPDISSTEAFKQALLNARSISYTADSVAGVYIAGLLQRLGIADQLKSRTKLLGGGGQNPRAVASGEVELGLSVISDIMGVDGAELIGPFPPEVQQYFAIGGVVGTTARDPTAAKALIDFVSSPENAGIIRSKGLEPNAK
jgi:molybdate transport system substrate-binding protein